jgi:hypothetical protein
MYVVYRESRKCHLIRTFALLPIKKPLRTKSKGVTPCRAEGQGCTGGNNCNCCLSVSRMIPNAVSNIVRPAS